MNIFLVVACVAILGVVATAIIATLRRVVRPNEVHIVQSAKKTTSYGKDTSNGNTYYEWPSVLPILGITKVILPVSVFDVSLNEYDAYDKDRVPFVVDITAFFRVSDTNVAAQRVSSFAELKMQLASILKGAVRTVLAGYPIDDIMTQRSTFGEQFTLEVQEQLKHWGVSAVKNIELMDIRDAKNNDVIDNIMSKRRSFIEMESRTEVAKNEKLAEIAEITAKQETDLREQEALELVGKRTAEKNQVVGIATQQSAQQIAEEEKVTKEKEMAVAQVMQVKAAEIAKEVALVQAAQTKEYNVTVADGQLTVSKLNAEGVKAAGLAEAAAKEAVELAPVKAQTTLAQEIGGNKDYQAYLIELRNVEMTERVGIEQAKALVSADLKIIANGGNVSSGIQSLTDVFSSKGGLAVASMLEGLGATDAGSELLKKVTTKK